MVRLILRALAILPIVLAGCAVPRQADIPEMQQRYRVAKAECATRYKPSLTMQADCRTDAANEYTRPWYRYGDLLTSLQAQRRALAVQADRREITRAEYDRRVARAEKAVAQEEARRNKGSEDWWARLLR